MSENDNTTTSTDDPSGAAPARKRTPRRKAVAAPVVTTPEPAADVSAPRKRTARKAVAASGAEPTASETPATPATPAAKKAGAKKVAAKKVAAKKTTGRSATAEPVAAESADESELPEIPIDDVDELIAFEPAAPAKRVRKAPPALMFQPPAPLFTPPVMPETSARPEADPDFAEQAPARRRTRTPRIVVADEVIVSREDTEHPSGPQAGDGGTTEDDDDGTGSRRRRRGRRGRGRRDEGSDSTETAEPGEVSADAPAGGSPAGQDDDSEDSGSTRRRRRRRRGGSGDDAGGDDPPRTVTRVREAREPREPREPSNEVRGLSGSTRLEAKKIRRREGREQSRRRPPVITESEFLARREAVERIMLVQQYADRTQIAVLEDNVLVEHYVTKAESTSFAGNVYLGRVQNVLISMEAAFVDIGKGRNAVLYAGEVNYDTSALEGRAPRIEQALKSGQEIVVQVTKDPIGQKGSRLTSQVSLPGRYMVYVPEGSMTGISRKLPDTERTRLKGILKTLKPEGAGIIVRTAAEGASEEDLTADLDRLKAQWESIEKAAKKGKAPALLHGEPDLVIRVIRDNFNEDFAKLIVSGSGDYDTIHDYLSYLAPDLMPRLEKWVEPTPLFDQHRVNEQLLKAMDRKVWLPSGGSLVIDRTEAMTVVDVNTGKFVGKGGNLEETVTKNNLEAAEEIVRQLRLRDIGGIIVVDFIDMVLESNRELVMRRLKECLGRDRTKHQVAEVTSLGLIQMTRKRISQGLIEAFSDTCEHCHGRGISVHVEMLGGTPGATTTTPPEREPRGREAREGRSRDRDRDRAPKAAPAPRTSIADVAAAIAAKTVAPSPAAASTAPAAGKPARPAARVPGAALAARAAAITDSEDDWAWAAGPVDPAPSADSISPAPSGASGNPAPSGASGNGSVSKPTEPTVSVGEAAASDVDGVIDVPAESSRPAGRRRGSRGRGRSKADSAPAGEPSDA